MKLPLNKMSVVVLVFFPTVSFSASVPLRTFPNAEKVDPTSIQISVKMDSIPAIGTSNVVKLGTAFTLSCSWDVKFLKPVTLHNPIPLDVRIVDKFNVITVLKSEPKFVTPGEYKIPGFQVTGGVIAAWKPEGLGNHEITCQAGVTAPEWSAPGIVHIAQATWKILVDPDKYKTCLPLYLSSVTKSPKMNPTDSVAPVDLLLGLDYSQGIGNQIICHYRSKSNDLPDFPVTISCPGVTLLPPLPGQVLKTDRFYCKE